MRHRQIELSGEAIKNPTALLILEDGTVLRGRGFGAERVTVGEVCFNTSMTGYQEIITDPSYAGQIITFTFPHIGNVGTNSIDIESAKPSALGLVVSETPTDSSNYRADQSLDDWLKSVNLPGIAGIDTRALTRKIRTNGAPKGVLAVNQSGTFNIEALYEKTKVWPGLKGLDLAKTVTLAAPRDWREGGWNMPSDTYRKADKLPLKVVAFDYGCKHNILRCLTDMGCAVTVVPATTSADEVLSLRPHGVFLSNGPGDPAATSAYAADTVRKLGESGTALFGICIGQQLIAEAFGAQTYKMARGHRGANHPVKDLETGLVEITSQNHGFSVEEKGLPDNLIITHRSLFDGTIEGLRHRFLPIFSVQYHPEASPGPHDAHHLFQRFATLMRRNQNIEVSHAKT